jgi:hypothetical protein
MANKRDQNYVIRNRLDQGAYDFFTKFLDPIEINPEEKPIPEMEPPITQKVVGPSTPEKKLPLPQVTARKVAPMGPIDLKELDYLDRQYIDPKKVENGVSKTSAYDSQYSGGPSYSDDYGWDEVIPPSGGKSSGMGQSGMGQSEMDDLIAQAIIQAAPGIIGYLFQGNQGLATGIDAGQKGMGVYNKAKDEKKAKEEKLRIEAVKEGLMLDDYVYKRLLQDAKEGKDGTLKKLELELKRKELGLKGKELGFKDKEMGYKGKELDYKGEQLELKKAGKDPEELRKTAKQEMELRKEVNSNKMVQSAVSAGSNYSKIMGANAKTGAGQIAIITSYMKMLDEGSVVRETEFAQAAKSGGYFAYLFNLKDSVEKGLVVDIGTIEKIRAQAQQYYDIQKDVIAPVYDYYSNIAQAQGLDLDRVVYNPLPSYESAVQNSNRVSLQSQEKKKPEISKYDRDRQRIKEMTKPEDIGMLRNIVGGFKEYFGE